MARRRSGEQYLREYLGDGYSFLDKNGKLVKGNNVLDQKSVRDQLKDVNAENAKRENRRITHQEAFRASDTIKKGRNILKSSTNDPGEKVMGMRPKSSTKKQALNEMATVSPSQKNNVKEKLGAGSKVTPPVKKNSSKKRSTTAKNAAKSAPKAPNKKLTQKKIK